MSHRSRRPFTSIAAAVAAAAALLAAGPSAAAVPPQAFQPAAAAAQRAPWTVRVSPSLVAAAVSGQGEVSCLVVLSEPAAVRALSPRALGAPARLRWIADSGDAVGRDYAPFGAVVTRRFSHLPIVAMRVPAAFIQPLAEDARVASISAVHTVHAMRAEAEALINVPAVRADGLDGTGTGIAILDTGVDYTNPELAPGGTDAAADKTILLYDAVNGQTAFGDLEGHGTSVAGIAAGSLGGVAPNAKIVSVRVLDASGNGNSTQIIAGINAVITSVTSGDPYHIKAANMSFGGYADSWPPGSGTCDTLDTATSTAMANLANAGVLPVVAAGNGGCSTGVAWPACVSAAVAVGGVYDASVGGITWGDSADPLQCGGNSCSDSTTAPDAIMCASDSGTKLDVWAPGYKISTTAMPGASINQCPSDGGLYDECFGGTSAAAPFVSGVAALLAQAAPGIAEADLRSLVRDTGTPITDSRNGITRNRIDALAALTQLQQTCPTPATPTGLAPDSATVCGVQSFTVSWSPVSSAASYEVEIAQSPDFGNAQTSTVTGTSTSYSPPASVNPEIYYVRVRATSTCGVASPYSAAVTVGYEPTCTSVTYPYTYYLTGIARTPGVPPAYWYSDVAVLDLAQAAADTRLTYYSSGAPLARLVSVPVHQQVTWKDVLSALFGITGTSVGAIVVQSTEPVAVLARTFSEVASGSTALTYGQYIPGLEITSALHGGQTGYFPNLRSDGTWRTNVEFLNVGTAAATVTVQFFDDQGNAVNQRVLASIQPYQRSALTAALASGQTAAWAEVTVSPPAAEVIGIASVIDGASTDPTTIPMFIP